MLRNLIIFGRFWQNFNKWLLKSVANCLYPMCLKEYIKISIYSWPNVVTFTMSKVGWVEIIKISIISSSILMTLTRLILAGLLFDLFYQNFNKIYQSVSCNQLKYINNRTYKHGFSTNDKWVWFTKRVWFVGCTNCTLQTLYAWLVRGLYVGMVGILIYRALCLSLRCDSWHTTMLLTWLNNTKCMYLLFTIDYTYKSM